MPTKEMDFSGSLYDDLLDDAPIISFAPQSIEQQQQQETIVTAPSDNTSQQQQEPEEQQELFPIALCKMFIGGLKWETTVGTLSSFILRNASEIF